jgi:hypothetical protein
MPRTGFIAITVAVLLASSCGASDSTVTGPAGDTSSQASAGVADVTFADGPCDIGGVITNATSIVSADLAPGANETVGTTTFATLRVSTPKVVEILRPEYGNPADLGDGDWAAVKLDTNAFIDPDVVITASAMRDAVLFVSQIDKTDLRILAVAFKRSDGSIELVGNCAKRWSSAVDVAARELGQLPDVEFYANVAKLDEKVVNAVQDAWGKASVAPDAVEGLTSLDLRDLSAAERANYWLTGLVLNLERGLPSQGFVQLRVGDGVLTTFALSGVEGVLPIMLPKAECVVTAYYLATNDATGREAGSTPCSKFDPEDGVRVSVENGTVGLAISLESLQPGELARELNISEAELVEYRESLLRG